MDSSTNRSEYPENAAVKTKFVIGLSLAVSSSLFIGSSFIIKKISLMKLSRHGNIRAGAGGFGYLKDWLWWLGFLTMGLGELLNFAAYAFAPASLVTPLGALSVLVSAILAAKFLNESLNNSGKLGCLLCILGSTIIVIHAPKEEQLESLTELLAKIQDPIFINYLLVVIAIVILIVAFIGPKFGNKYATVYILLCSAVGSLTVMGCKGLGLAVREAFEAAHLSQNIVWTSLILLLTILLCISIQMNYLNKSLDLFSTSVVTPIYYVMFTTFVIVVSTVLFKEWTLMSEEDILGSLCGFFVTVVAIFLLNSSRNDKQNIQPLLTRTSSREYGSGIYSSRNV